MTLNHILCLLIVFAGFISMVNIVVCCFVYTSSEDAKQTKVLSETIIITIKIYKNYSVKQWKPNSKIVYTGGKGWG